MHMTLHETIKEQVTAAMRAKDAFKLLVLRSILSAFTNESVSKGKTPDAILADADAIAVIRRIAKQRKESIVQFRAGAREDLAKNEEAELAMLEAFLPALMSKEDIKKVAEAKKAELGTTDKAGLGKLVGAVMKELGARADGKDVKEVVESLF